MPTLGLEDGIFPTEGTDQSWGTWVEEGDGKLNWFGMTVQPENEVEEELMMMNEVEEGLPPAIGG